MGDRELARADDGRWRLDLLEVEAGRVLAPTPGQERLLTVVGGPVLQVESGGSTHVLEPSRPFPLAGGIEVTATPLDGDVRVLVVTADADRTAPVVTVLELGRGSTLPLAVDQRAYVVTGAGQGELVTGPGEVVGRCTVAVVTLERR
ncbi:hypothetical protein GCM10011376_21250 [Nocardioides flavus (ex Wang et al. 2016)]|uniref:HutD protein n=1 Tax=Nocardioides flavus (ex Wang et al. 2016) TaxID=2058780 RepID=A0ABQ3HKS4_9ACTN|nr:HutD family protein [Nocardioides flavus (ex Wang et al. 2016)]GHE17515.1 hypothetical protein GCM10011376_21250 [Nocardioides flavus (ex Wang et al. 2016)]